MTAYEDFDLLFRTGPDGVPHVRATRDHDAGEEEVALRLPPELEDVPHLVPRLLEQAREGRARARDLTPVDSPPTAADLGVTLYRSLFDGAIGRLLAASRAARPAGSVLRIRLQYDLEDERARELAALPWELMRDPETDTALVLSRDHALIRRVDMAQTVRPPPYSPPLRILFAMSNPLADLDLEAERSRIEDRLRSHPEIVPEFHTVDSLSDLEERLNAGAFHVIHFMGHGDFAGGEGRLLIGDRLYGAGHLAPVIGRSRATRLVVLNACRTAQIPRDHGQDPFAGIAVALVRKGVPAVVAMQFPIPDDAAALFAERFYTGIAGCSPLEEAVDTARMRLWTEYGASEYDAISICATPVLFLRGSGDLFGGRQAPVSEGDVPTLVTFMLDRLEVVQRIESALGRADTDADTPLVAITHGANEACFDTLVERLQRRELPRYVTTDRLRQSIRRFRFEWPPPWDTPGELHDFLTFSIARRVTERGGATRDELARYLGDLPAPPLVYGMLSAATWQKCGGRRCVDEFLAYWSEWPRPRSRQRIIVLLGITYATPEPPARGLRRWLGRRTRPVNEEIEEALRELAGRGSDGPPVVVLPKLGGISYDHAHSWALETGRPDLIPLIRRAWEACAAETGEDTMSMERASELLEAMLADEPTNQGAA